MTPGPGASPGMRGHVALRLPEPYSSSLSSPGNVSRVPASALTPAEARPSRPFHPAGCALRVGHRREPSAADPGEPWLLRPPSVRNVLLLLSCLPARCGPLQQICQGL